MTIHPLVRSWLLLIVFSVVVLGAAPNPLIAAQRLMVTGSSTVAPIALEIAKRFETKRPDIQIDVQTGGSSRGIQDVRVGLADIGMASRSLKPAENDLLSHTIALDAVAIITHADNPVQRLDRPQIIDIYTDKINDWSQIGKFEGPIVVVNKAEGRSTLELFLEYTNLLSNRIKADIIIGDNEQAIKIVAANPQSIAYVSIAAAIYNMENGLPIRIIAVDGIAPDIKSLAAGKLPMTRELNLVTVGEPNGIAADFITFAQSSAVADILDAFYVLPPTQ